MSTGNTQPAQGGIQGLLAKAPDPLHLSNGGGALDPLNEFGSPTPGMGTPSTLSNLGAASMIPKMPGGAFMPMNLSGGGFNAMAAQGAGRLFNPAASRPQAAPAQFNPADPALLEMLKRRFSVDGSKR